MEKSHGLFILLLSVFFKVFFGNFREQGETFRDISYRQQNFLVLNSDLISDFVSIHWLFLQVVKHDFI